MAVTIRATFYRFEQTGDNTFAKSDVLVNKVVNVVDIDAVDPVNTLGGQDIGGFPYIYSKLTLKQPALNQELFAMQTVLQMQAAMEA